MRQSIGEGWWLTYRTTDSFQFSTHILFPKIGMPPSVFSHVSTTTIALEIQTLVASPKPMRFFSRRKISDGVD